MRGVFAPAVRAASEEIVAAHAVVDIPRLERAWKLLLLLPRMLLTKPRRGGVCPQEGVGDQIGTLLIGVSGTILMRQRIHSCEEASRVATRRSRRQGIDTVEKRGARAERLVQLGEISAGRQALESGKVAPGTLATLRALTDPDRRPPVPREPLG